MLRRLYEGSPADGRRERPVGVVIIAALSLVSALLVAYYALGALVALFDGAPGGALVQLVGGVALGVLLVTIASGLWRLKRWAQWLAASSMVVAVVVLAVDALARYGFGNGLSTAMSLILSRSIAPLGMALYLVHPSISKFFTK